MAKKVVIAYATAGSGHRKAAEALAHAAAEQGQDARAVDIVEYMPWLGRKMYSDGYLLLISQYTPLWGLLYWLSDIPGLRLLNVHVRRFLDGVVCRRFIRYLVQERPDVVIATHFLASELVTIAKIKYGLRTRLATVVTDFGVHNFWINRGTDVYCVATDATKKILIRRGVVPDRVVVTGIPLDKKFTYPVDRRERLRAWKLDPEKFTVLVATGGVGIGPIEDVVRQLKDETQLLVVCGTNEQLQKKLAAENHPNVRVFGFVDFMHELMNASDVIVTKAGGLSVTESLTKHLCCVFFYIIPGQEEHNAKTITQHEAGFFEHTARRVARRIRQLKGQPHLLEACRAHARELARPSSCQDILKHALSS